MPDHELSPYDIGGTGLADSFWNLCHTLESWTADEPANRKALRLQSGSIARALAESWTSESRPVDSHRTLNYHRTLWKLRDFAVELCPSERDSPSGLRVVFEAFRDRFLPDAVVTLRPAGLAAIAVREHMGPFKERLQELGILETLETSAPLHPVIAVRFPAGEQDHSLMACTALASFHLPRFDLPFAIANAGPAVFFAAAANIQNHKGLSDALEPPRLCFMGELLEIAGWLEHPVVGPLIQRWRDHFGFNPDYLDRKILNPTMLKRMRELQEDFRSTPIGYTSADYDRSVPGMCERMRAGLPPAESNGASPDVISVVNAGWTFAQLHLNDLYATLQCTTALERYRARVALNGLVAKAIHP